MMNSKMFLLVEHCEQLIKFIEEPLLEEDLILIR